MLPSDVETTRASTNASIVGRMNDRRVTAKRIRDRRGTRLADPDGNTLTLQEMSWRTGDNF